MQNKKIYFFGIEPMKMHCNFTYPTNAFYPKFCKIKNSRGYERNRTQTIVKIGSKEVDIRTYG